MKYLKTIFLPFLNLFCLLLFLSIYIRQHDDSNPYVHVRKYKLTRDSMKRGKSICLKFPNQIVEEVTYFQPEK